MRGLCKFCLQQQDTEVQAPATSSGVQLVALEMIVHDFAGAVFRGHYPP